ncbi:MAG TPA: cupin domain-containing protein [Chloroflexota bacterium]|nr:cupin domain-containing protein [Chloroflexota bacterium]
MAVRVPLLDVGRLTARLDEIIAQHGEPPWSETMMINEDMQAYFIANAPGHPTDTHYHHHDEWWIVLKGEIDWWIEGNDGPIHAKTGDFVIAPRLHWHHIEPVGNELTIRLAINTRGEFHKYDRPGCREKPWRLKPGETPETAMPDE